MFSTLAFGKTVIDISTIQTAVRSGPIRTLVWAFAVAIYESHHCALRAYADSECHDHIRAG